VPVSSASVPAYADNNDGGDGLHKTGNGLEEYAFRAAFPFPVFWSLYFGPCILVGCVSVLNAIEPRQANTGQRAGQ
jgi:hypothetical protein